MQENLKQYKDIYHQLSTVLKIVASTALITALIYIGVVLYQNSQYTYTAEVAEYSTRNLCKDIKFYSWRVTVRRDTAEAQNKVEVLAAELQSRFSELNTLKEAVQHCDSVGTKNN